MHWTKGSPVMPVGHEHVGLCSMVVQIAKLEQGFSLEQGLMHFLFLQAWLYGHSGSDEQPTLIGATEIWRYFVHTPVFYWAMLRKYLLGHIVHLLCHWSLVCMRMSLFFWEVYHKPCTQHWQHMALEQGTDFCIPDSGRPACSGIQNLLCNLHRSQVLELIFFIIYSTAVIFLLENLMKKVIFTYFSHMQFHMDHP